ncbi:hypothetical protein PS838_06167 [Pseudomonas fluorescens]|nr:hypothetical protein PS838_06167 [Pseudomonas fluorescens]
MYYLVLLLHSWLSSYKQVLHGKTWIDDKKNLYFDLPVLVGFGLFKKGRKRA